MSRRADPLGVALVVVGDEVLTGRVADRNGPWLAGRLTSLGARVAAIEIVGDQAETVAGAVRAAAAAADVVVVTGGLGPTDDDGTRAGLARAARRPLVEHPEALASVERAQALRGFSLDARRRREALLPEDAQWIENPEGTAPGVRMEVDGTTVLALPGVPHEMHAMFEQGVVPALVALGRLAPAPSVAFRAGGVREPDVAERLADLGAQEGVHLALYPHEGELEIRFQAEAGADPAALECVRADAWHRLGDAVYENRSIEAEVVRRLGERGWSVTTAESLTGGLVARMLTSVPGASAVFAGGWVTYSDAWKQRSLGVPSSLLRQHGAVSAEAVRAMAEGARVRAQATAALATTGFAGPGPGRAPDGALVPAGTFFVAVAITGRETRVVGTQMPAGRLSVQRRAAVLVLEQLRRALAEAPEGA